MNKNVKKSLSLSLVLVMFLTFITMIKPIQSNAADYSAWSSIFDPTYYATNYADAASYANGNVDLLWQHFVQVGIPSGRQGSAEFNVYIYAQNYPELVNAYGGDFIQYYIHYATVGKSEGRNAMSLNSAPAQNKTATATSQNTNKTAVTTTTANTTTVTQTTTSYAKGSYVLNTNTMKCHKPGCSSVSTIKAKNRWDYSGTIAEIQSMGYSPCQRCYPW